MNKYIRKIALFITAFGLITLTGCVNSTSNSGLNISFAADEYLIQEGSCIEMDLELFVRNGSLGTTTLEWIIVDPNVVKYEDGILTGLNAGTTLVVVKSAVDPSVRTEVRIVVEPTYYITYDANGGVVNDANPTKYYDTHCPYTLLDATRDGYTFEGWYDENGQKVEKIEKGDKTNFVLTAKWNPITYSIKYNVNGGNMVQSFDTYEEVVEELVLAFNTYNDYNYSVDDFKNNNLTEMRMTAVATFFMKNGEAWDWLLQYFQAFSPNASLISLVESANMMQDINQHNPDAIPAIKNEFIAFVSGTTILNNEGVAVTGDYADEEVKNQCLEFDTPVEFTVLDSFDIYDAYKTGYKFLGWFDENGQKVRYIPVGTIGNISLTAEFEIID